MNNIFDTLINKFYPYTIKKVKVDPEISVKLERCLLDSQINFELIKNSSTMQERDIYIDKYKSNTLEYNSIMQFIISKYAPKEFLELIDPPLILYNAQLQSVVFTIVENRDLKTIEEMKKVGLEFLKSYLKECTVPRKDNIQNEKSEETSSEDRLSEIREEDWSSKQ